MYSTSRSRCRAIDSMETVATSIRWETQKTNLVGPPVAISPAFDCFTFCFVFLFFFFRFFSGDLSRWKRSPHRRLRNQKRVDCDARRCNRIMALVCCLVFVIFVFFYSRLLFLLLLLLLSAMPLDSKAVNSSSLRRTYRCPLHYTALKLFNNSDTDGWRTPATNSFHVAYHCIPILLLVLHGSRRSPYNNNRALSFSPFLSLSLSSSEWNVSKKKKKKKKEELED